MHKIDTYKKIQIIMKDLNPIKIFLVLALLFGTLFVLITPPFQGPDEPVHFYRATQIANVNFIPDVQNGVVGGDTDNGYIRLVRESFDDTKLFFQPNNTIDARTVTALIKIKETDNESTFIDFQATANYSPISYLAPATGIAIADVFGMPPLFALYLARFACLFTWIALSVLALKNIQVKRGALATILLIPMLIFQCSVISADSLSIGAITLFLTLIWKYSPRTEPITKRNILTLVAISLILVSTKQLNFIFLPFLLLIGKSTKKSIALKSIGTGIIFAFSFLWLLIIKSSIGEASFAGGEAVPKDQIAFIKANPFHLIRIFNNTYFSNVSDGIFKSMLGTFGWLDTPLPTWINALSLLFVVLAIFSADTNSGNKRYIEKMPKIKRNMAFSFTVLIAILYFIAVSLTLYVYYTPPGFESFYGIQGRYFLPILILFATCPLILTNNVINIKKRINYLYLGQFMILVISIMTLTNRYYNA